MIDLLVWVGALIFIGYGAYEGASALIVIQAVLSMLVYFYFSRMSLCNSILKNSIIEFVMFFARSSIMWFIQGFVVYFLVYIFRWILDLLLQLWLDWQYFPCLTDTIPSCVLQSLALVHILPIYKGIIRIEDFIFSLQLPFCLILLFRFISQEKYGCQSTLFWQFISSLLEEMRINRS